MKKSIKAALFSALVFPGTGHLVLKKPIVAVAFISAFSAALYFFLSDVVSRTQQVMAQIKAGEIPLDVAAISAALEQQPSDSQVIFYVLVGLWIAGIVDSYRIGRATDQDA